MQERQVIHSLWVEMGHRALACGSTSLGWGEKWLNGDGGEGVGGLRGKGLKESMGSITVCKGEVF